MTLQMLWNEEMLPLKKRHVKPLPKLNQHGKARMQWKKGQDTKEAYNRTLEKQELTKMKPAKGWFCFVIPLPLTLQRVRLCAAIFMFLKKKNIKIPSYIIILFSLINTNLRIVTHYINYIKQINKYVCLIELPSKKTVLKSMTNYILPLLLLLTTALWSQDNNQNDYQQKI
jgi:hypothetical protein